MSDHAEKYQPSSASVWIACTGYPEMIRDCTSVDTPEATEGNIAHQLASDILTLGHPVNPCRSDPEILDHIAVYIDECNRTPGTHHIEERVECKRVHEKCWGTCDFWSYDEATHILYISDLKYGWGLVESFWQLVCYGAGIIDQLWIEYVDKIVLKIIQPRPFHNRGPVRELVLNTTQFLEMVDKLHDAANTTNPTLSTGPHCRYCSKMLECTANLHCTLSAIDISEIPMYKEHVNAGRELDALYRAKDAIKHRLAAREAEAEQRIKNGQFVEGWELTTVNSGGRSSWLGSKPDIENMATLLGIDIVKKDLITPVQAIKKGMPEELVKANAKMPQGRLKLTKVDPNRATKLFGE